MATSAKQTATACITMQASESPPILLGEDKTSQNEPIHTAGEFGDGADCRGIAGRFRGMNPPVVAL